MSFGGAVSPDGKYVAISEAQTGNLYLYPIEGGEKRRVAVLEPREVILQWSADGSFLYVERVGDIPTKVFRLEISTGKREPWKDLAPADRAGLISIPSVAVARDGRSYAYAYGRVLASDLFVIDGLK